MACSICNHPQRAQIENAILNAPTTETLQQLANVFDINMTDLQVHACMHSPIGVNTEDIGKDSITRKIKKREADMLLAAANEYMVTLKSIGDKISTAANECDDFSFFSRSISKATVDLYLGAGSELRNTIKTIVEIDNALNGPSEGPLSGMQALADAIRGSRKKDD